MGPSDPGPHALGAVHDRATAHGDDGLGSAVQIELPALLHILDSGVGHSAVIDSAEDAFLGQGLLQRGRKAQGADGTVGDQQDGAHPTPLEQRRDGVQSVQLFGLPVGEKGERQPEGQLKSAAGKLFQRMHSDIKSYFFKIERTDDTTVPGERQSI